MDAASCEMKFVKHGARRPLSVIRLHHKINSLRGFKMRIYGKLKVPFQEAPGPRRKGHTAILAVDRVKFSGKFEAWK